MKTIIFRHPALSASAILAAIIVVGALLRVWNIGGPALWGDELYSITFARMPLHFLWGDWMVRETNPPLFYTILKGWMHLFGEEDVVLRILPITVGLIGIGAIFVFVRALYSTPAALVAAALAAVSSLQITYSFDVRGYIFSNLFATLSLFALVKLIDVWKSDDVGYRRQAPWLALYAVTAWACFHIHTTFAILPVVCNLAMGIIYFWRTPRSARVAIGWLSANAALLLASLWWASMTIQRVREGASPISWIPEPTAKEVVAIMSHIVATRSFQFANIIFAGLLGAVMIWGAWRLPVERRILVGVIGVAGPVLLVAASFIQPVFLERTAYWYQFIYYGCIAVGFVSLPWRRWRATAVAVTLGVLTADMFTWELSAYRESWRDMARILREEGTERDVVFFYAADAGLNMGHYCRLDGCGPARFMALSDGTWNTVLPEYMPGDLVDRADLGAYVRTYDRIWVVRRRSEHQTPALEKVAKRETENLVDRSENDAMALEIWRPIR